MGRDVENLLLLLPLLRRRRALRKGRSLHRQDVMSLLLNAPDAIHLPTGTRRRGEERTRGKRGRGEERTRERREVTVAREARGRKGENPERIEEETSLREKTREKKGVRERREKKKEEEEKRDEDEMRGSSTSEEEERKEETSDEEKIDEARIRRETDLRGQKKRKKRGGI